MTSKERLKHLLKLYADNAATSEEIKEMLSLVRQDGEDKALESFIMELRQETKNDALNIPVDWETMWESIHPSTPVKKMHWWRVAAAVIIMLCTASYFWFNSHKKTSEEIVRSGAAQEPAKDIQPGGNKAVLTLADGSQIVLDTTANGRLATQGNMEIIKLSNGELAYKGTANNKDEVLYNTMSTPRGGQYSLILPDGSKVWLNAISSIRYPTTFKGSERKVEITGEAYFEVAKDHSRPFKVSVQAASGKGHMQVEVLGTHFNINAYSDEPLTNTTLLEGSVKVITAAGNTVIKPGQQAQVNDDGKIKTEPDISISDVMAWKDGYFTFKDSELKTIMRQIMRWYDVEVKYENDNTPNRYFTADISRSKTLSGVLKILEQSNIHFKLEGRILTVMS
ncbi:MAG: FecR domain-containing protein [Chitinophagaceae bacterium]|nr:FecR domain-containing protein [Chitinophagaceae bacterium]